MGKFKDKMYDSLVRKNENVRYEYERYVMENRTEHYENRRKHWKILFQLKLPDQKENRSNALLGYGKCTKAGDGEREKTERKNLIL